MKRQKVCTVGRSRYDLIVSFAYRTAKCSALHKTAALFVARTRGSWFLPSASFRRIDGPEGASLIDFENSESSENKEDWDPCNLQPSNSKPHHAGSLRIFPQNTHHGMNYCK